MNIDDYAKLVAESFMDDPGVKYQLANVQRGSMLFELQCKGEIETFSQEGYVKANDKGVMAGYLTSKLTGEKLLACMQKSAQYILKAITEEEFAKMQQNAIIVSEVTPFEWYKEYIGDQEAFVLQTIVIAKAFRGSGAFRELIMPVLEECDNKQIPIVLQTHQKKNVPIYEHFGFKVMAHYETEQGELECFCMMRA